MLDLRRKEPAQRASNLPKKMMLALPARLGQLPHVARTDSSDGQCSEANLSTFHLDSWSHAIPLNSFHSSFRLKSVFRCE